MKILAIDTSTKNFSVAVTEDNRVLSCRNFTLDKILSSSIVPTIDRLLKKVSLSLKDIDGFAVGLGPGSFTSLRVGLSTIKAFAFSLGKPVVGISSLDVIAQNVKNTKSEEICVISDAKRSLVYSCLYKKNGAGLKPKSRSRLVAIDEVLQQVKKPSIFVGDGVSFYKDRISQKMKKGSLEFAGEKEWKPQAKCLAMLALERFKNKQTDDVDTIVPYYLYPEDCQVVRKKK